MDDVLSVGMRDRATCPRRRGRQLGLDVAVGIGLLASWARGAQANEGEAPAKIGEFISHVCADGHDEDWRQDGPVLVLTGDWRGGPVDDAPVPAFRTPFVLYGDGTAIAETSGGDPRTVDALKHTKYRLARDSVADLMRSLNWEKLLQLDDNYRPIQEEQARWQQSHTCFDACWPYLELHLWSDGCRKTISIAGLEGRFLRLIAANKRLSRRAPDADRFDMARLAFRRLPPELQQALLQLARFWSAGGTVWCRGAGCARELPWHEAWGYRGRVLTLPGPESSQREAKPGSSPK
jgi:hypothetical protein